MLLIFFTIGSLLLFIFGMTILRFGLFNIASLDFKSILANLTDKTWKGLLVGTIVTAILQSSSAVMVITIGLIGAGVISFRQSIGIILGTNIGTTVTAEFLTLNLNKIILPLLIIGALFIIFKNTRLKSVGLIFFGIATIFVAMNNFQLLAEPLLAIDAAENIIKFLNNELLASILAGSFITAIIQSSTALLGITMSFLTTDVISLKTGIALMLGSNIGTCMTAYIATIGAGREARLCAYAHIWLNVLGVIAFYPFISLIAESFGNTGSTLDAQLAHISVLFNLISSIIVLPFAKLFANFILKLHDR